MPVLSPDNADVFNVAEALPALRGKTLDANADIFNVGEAFPALVLIPAPTNTVAPAVSGSAPVGSTLSATDGTWTGSPTFTYQWTRDAVNISAATSSTYTSQAADVGHAVGCTVTGTNAGGNASAASSNTITVTAAATTGTSPQQPAVIAAVLLQD